MSKKVGGIPISEFAKIHNLSPRSVLRHMTEGYCRWPRKQNDGRTAHPLYMAWKNMRVRCYDKNCPKYERYGGRGITVCSSWYVDFWAFVEDMGPKPGPEYSIDRIDNDGNYEPGNCRWATKRQQTLNKRAKKNFLNEPYIKLNRSNNYEVFIVFPDTKFCKTFTSLNDAKICRDSVLALRKKLNGY